MHLFGAWLATAAATTRPATWADFVQLLRKTGVDEGVVQTVPGGPWDSHQSDVFHISVGQQPPVTAKAVQELSTKQVDPPRGVSSGRASFTQTNLLCVHTLLCMSKCSMTKVSMTKVEKHRLDLDLDLGLTAQWLQQFASSTEVSTLL